MPRSREERFDLLAGWEKRAEWPLAIIAALFLIAYSVDVLGDPGRLFSFGIGIVVGLSWLVFVVDYFVRLSITPDRGRWFVRHLFDLAVVVLPILRPLRLVSLVILVGALQKALGGAIRGRVAIYTSATAILLIYVASLAVYDAERGRPGATITSFGDAVWWSFVTVTTVGYGDFAPVTITGRVVAVLLMIGGISLIGVVTATIASWIVERVAEEDDAGRAATAAEIRELKDEIRMLRESLGAEGGVAAADADITGMNTTTHDNY
ncbi:MULTISPECIES: potassium channel family protein [unclassified Gordonia (in: high G+C Gram-positive bacteria)]|uniref:potassium channel family protein n=1 Tax=Gordonia sp. VNQ95 TaxID=3156619 RepID=UPI0032B55F2C